MIARAPLPAEQVLAAQRCASCPKMCRGACPTLAVTGNERHQPWGHAQGVVAALASGAGFGSPAIVDSAFACATCSACTPPCKVDGVETPDLTWAVRAAVFAAGATPELGHRSVAEARAGRVAQSMQPPSWVDPEETLRTLRGMATPGAPLVLFPGCGVLGRRPRAALAAATALSRLGVAFDVPAGHSCCGMPALTFGDTGALMEMLDGVIEQLSRQGWAPLTVSVQSPSCAYMLGRRAALLGRSPRVRIEPLAATLARALAGRDSGAGAAIVAYHDPCYLARHQSVVEEPRAALRAAGYAVRELRSHRATAACSGQGGGLPLTHPDIADGYLRRLVDDISGAGVDAVVTGCASCAAVLDGAVDGVAVQELAEAIVARLEETG